MGFKEVFGGIFGTGKPSEFKDETIEELKKRLEKEDPKTLGDFYKSRKGK
jgi:hypothetical protein